MKYGSLRLACESNDITRVQRLLDQGAGVNEADVFKWTPIMFAAYNGNAQITKLLIDKKADIHAKSNVGKTPLMIAAAGGSVLCVDTLIMSGSDIGAKNHTGVTALVYAIANDKRETAGRLLDWGLRDDSVILRPYWFQTLVEQRRLVKDTILFVQALLRKRLRVCKDMAGEIGKKIWETRNDEKWTEERGGKKSKII